MKKELLKTLTEITNLEAEAATTTTIQAWHDTIKRYRDKLTDKYRLQLLKSVFSLFIKAFVASEKTIIHMIKMINPDNQLLALDYDSLSEDEKLAVTLIYSPKEEHPEKIRQLNTTYKHFYLLRMQLRTAISNPLSDTISRVITDVIDSFMHEHNENISTLMNKDPRVASTLGVVYLSEYRRRPIHPKNKEFLESAIHWFGMAAQKQEPCACNYFASLIEKDNPQSKTVKRYYETARLHGYPVDEAFPPIGKI